MKLIYAILLYSISVGSLIAVGNSNYMTAQEYLALDHEFDEPLWQKCLKSCCGQFWADALNGSHPHVPRYIKEISRCVKEGNDQQAHYYIQWLINHGKVLNSYREFINELIKIFPKHKEIFIFLIDAEYLTPAIIRDSKLIKYAIDCENIASIEILSEILQQQYRAYDHDEIMLSSLFNRNNICSQHVREIVYDRIFNLEHTITYRDHDNNIRTNTALTYEQSIGCVELIEYLESLFEKKK